MTPNEPTSRQRVLDAIDHRQTDRLPRDFDATPEMMTVLVGELGLTETQLREKFRCDLTRVWLHYDCPYTDGRNLWGLRIEKTDATYAIVEHPLADARTVADVDACDWPDPDWADVDRAARETAEARATGRAVVCSSWGSIFGEAYRLMGMDNFMTALALAPEVAETVVRKVTAFFLEVDRRLFDACGDAIDLSFHGNDFGTQRALLMSRDMFRRFFVPNIRALADQAKRFGLRTMFHSCGAVREIIGDLIDCGIDVLDPVQVTADGMDPRGLVVCHF